MTVLALHSSGACRANTPTYPEGDPVVPFPVFQEPGEEPLAQPNEVEEPDGLFRLDTPDSTATPHL